MTNFPIETRRLRLMLQSPEETRAMIDGMSDSDKAELSADWLAKVEAATAADPWIHGFVAVRRRDDVPVGNGGFKGPPREGVVEIAYGIAPEHQGKGYASEFALALTTFALKNDDIRIVRAHTLPEANASTRVLTKCGFGNVGEFDDPEDGPVWRWERHAN